MKEEQIKREKMLLSDPKPGEGGVIIQLVGGQGLRQKLALRGIKAGCYLRVVSSSSGPLVVESNGLQIAMGRGMARKVIVKPIGRRCP